MNLVEKFKGTESKEGIMTVCLITMLITSFIWDLKPEFAENLMTAAVLPITVISIIDIRREYKVCRMFNAALIKSSLLLILCLFALLLFVTELPIFLPLLVIAAISNVGYGAHCYIKGE